jgi:hypothetical protein
MLKLGYMFFQTNNMTIQRKEKLDNICLNL